MKQPDIDKLYMQRCLQLAALGRAHVSPNPMVGAVVVCDGKIIGEGYHTCCGKPHAEVNAIAAVRDDSMLTRATIYVSLEPCSHYGKTPPCSELIIAKAIPRVVVGCLDPFPAVSGRGVALLRKAGVEVTAGVLEAECRALNASFIKAQEQHRPYVTLKWAASADGFIDGVREPHEPAARISSEVTITLSHRLRTINDAILVGRRTALYDNPSLTVRHWTGRQPLRVVVDRELTLPSHLHLLSDNIPTVVFTNRSKQSEGAVQYETIDFSLDIIPQLLERLHAMKVQSLLVEGGRELLQSFVDGAYWDEIQVEQGDKMLGDGVAVPTLSEGLGRSRYYGKQQLARYKRIEEGAWQGVNPQNLITKIL